LYIALRDEIREYSKENRYYISVTSNLLPSINHYINELESRGIKYYLSVKSKDNLSNVFFTRMCEQNIKKSGKAILLLDDETLNDKESYNFAMYESGLIMSEEKTLFLVNYMSKEVINTLFINSPIKNAQLSTFEGVFKEVDKFIMLPKNLFNNQKIDAYSSKRIFYIKLLTMLDIRYGGLKKIYERLKERESDIEISDVFSMLEESVSTGVKLMHFGKLQLLNRGDFWPYFDEMNDLLIDFPVKSVVNKIKILKKEFEDNNEDSDVVATIKMEFIIPNNEVLGATFKPYFQIDNNEIKPNDIIELLRDDDVTEESICVVKENSKRRIYYSMNVDEKRLENELRTDLEEIYGKMSNYVYPK